MVTTAVNDETSPWEELKNNVEEELAQVKGELDEINLMIEQSQIELNKLAQRNASITAHMQQMQGQFETLPRDDIRSVYDSALDTQQRLFVMRGQLEKMQSDRNYLRKMENILGRFAELFAGGSPFSAGGRVSAATVDMVEMMIQAQEAERQHLARQMHDGPAQALSNLILQSEIAMRLFDRDQDMSREELMNLKSSATRTFQQIRDFIFELRPMMLDDLGLAPTVKRYVDAINEQSGSDIQLTVTGVERRLETYLEVMVFRGVQELITNVLRHSQASQTKLQVDLGDSNVKVTVDDNGKGFDVSILDEGESMGLKLIKDRAEMLGGFMEVDSLIGQGTRITFQVPAATEDALS
jgi:two-component system sensor histidine kinase DegS